MMIHRHFCRLLAGAVLACSVLAGAVACSSGPGTGGSGAGNAQDQLGQALSAIQDSANVRSSIQFVAVQRIQKLVANPANSGYRRYLDEMVNPDFAHLSSAAWNKALGFDPLAATWTVTAGTTPHLLTVVSGGVHASLVGDRIRALGAKQTASGTWTTWRLRPDDYVSQTDALARAFPCFCGDLTNFDLIGTGRDMVVGGADTAALNAATGSGGPWLADNSALAAVADCLGDPVEATVVGKLPTPSGQLPVGIGALAPLASGGTDILCVATTSAAQASQVASHLRTSLGGGEPRGTWGVALASSTVTVPGGPANLVKVTARPAKGVAPGAAFQGILSGGLLGDLI